MGSRVVFFGYGELAVAGLETLASAGAHITSVVVPGNRTGPALTLIRDAAARRGLPVLVQPPRRHLAPFVDTLRDARPDVIVVWSYSMMLPGSVLDVPRFGAVNVHGGPLPEYRGGHVAQWAIINGEREFGATLHYIDEGIDTGPVIAGQRFPLTDADDALSVRHKLRAAGSELLAQWWPGLADGTAPRVAQDDSRARYWPMRTPEDGHISWVEPAETICRLVRALRANSPGAYTEIAGRQISIRCAEPRPSLVPAAQPGRLVAVEPSGVRIAATGGDVLIVDADIDGTQLSVGRLAEAIAAHR